LLKAGAVLPQKREWVWKPVGYDHFLEHVRFQKEFQRAGVSVLPKVKVGLGITTQLIRAMLFE
jgi:hypothetical protein